MFRTDIHPICGPPRRAGFAVLLLIAFLVATPGMAQWVLFEDKTAERSNVADNVWATDPEEKDYDVADLDKDGDLDLVVVRKQPVTSAGKRTNLLMMNVNGVLTDRTAEFATTSDVPGDQGFLTPTNDRDVEIVDLNNDNHSDVIAIHPYDGQFAIFQKNHLAGVLEDSGDIRSNKKLIIPQTLI